MDNRQAPGANAHCRAAVIWIDWYAYHLARFGGLQAAFGSAGEVTGIELVGGVGVHAGLRFREDLPLSLPIVSLFPEGSWAQTGKLRIARAVWRKLTELDPELVLVPGYYNLPAIAAALWAKLHGRLSVLMTESTAFDHIRTGWKERLKGLLIRLLFDRAVTGGTAHRLYLQQLGFPMARVRGRYDVVDNHGIAERTRTLRADSKATEHGLPTGYFLFIGRLAEEKNVAGLLQAWVSYRTDGGTWPLVLVGDGPEKARLVEWAGQTGYARDVIFAGHKGSAALSLYQAFAGCFVLPSTREPWGLVVNEAMAAGLPVIVSTRCGCAADLVEHGRNGLLFNPASDGELAACLHLMEALSERERQRMGSASAERIAAFSPENFGREILSLLSPEVHEEPQTFSPSSAAERVA